MTEEEISKLSSEQRIKECEKLAEEVFPHLLDMFDGKNEDWHKHIKLDYELIAKGYIGFVPLTKLGEKVVKFMVKETHLMAPHEGALEIEIV